MLPTFQLSRLFRQLTLYENLLVVTHVHHNPTGFGPHLIVSGRAVAHEAAAMGRVNEIPELLDLAHLGDYLSEPAGEKEFVG